jgi:hypothetical protein
VPIARRKKTINIDGAEFIFSPLTYDELEHYALLQEELRTDVSAGKIKEDSADHQKRLRSRVFYFICCGLNNAKPEVQKLQSEKITAIHSGKTDEEAELIYKDGMKILAAEGIAVTEKNLRAEMDDDLASDLWREIFKFTDSGITILSKEDIRKIVKDKLEKEKQGKESKSEGEAQASS